MGSTSPIKPFFNIYCNLIITVVFLKVSTAKEGKIVDGKCHSLTASYIRERHNYDDTTPVCQYYEGFNMDGKESMLPHGVYSLDDLKQYGRDRNWCPYFLARFAVKTHFYFNLHSQKICCTQIYYKISRKKNQSIITNLL